MPRKPTRHRKYLRRRQLTFSSFARLMAITTCNKVAKHKRHDVKLKTKDFPPSRGNGSVKQVNAESNLSNSSSDEEFEGVVQADFGGFSLKSTDFHGVKGLLQYYLDNKRWDLSGFVDLILEQQAVGTAIKIENDEDDVVYALVTVLNLGRYKDTKCMTELKDYLLEVCRGKNEITKLQSLLGEHAQDVGLLVSQCVVNLPPQLLPPVYDTLFDDVVEASKNELAEDLRNSFRFKFYLIISKLYQHKNADQVKGLARNGEEAVIYIKPEDEIFHELSLWSFCFPLHTQQVTASELKHYRRMGLVMAVDASKVGAFRKQLHSLIDENT